MTLLRNIFRIQQRTQRKIYHDCGGGIEKSVPRITDLVHKACRVMTNDDRMGPVLRQIMDLFASQPLNSAFYS